MRARGEEREEVATILRVLSSASPGVVAFVVAVLSWAAGVPVAVAVGELGVAPLVAVVPVAIAGWRGADSRAPAPARELSRWVAVWYFALGLLFAAVLSALLVAVALGWRP